MEAGDGQQVHQARLGEAILQLGVDAAAAAQHQRIDQRGAGRRTATGWPGRAMVRIRAPRRGDAVRRPRAGDHQNAAGSTARARPRYPAALDSAATARRRPARRPASAPRPRLRTRRCTGSTCTRPPSIAAGSASRTVRRDAAGREARGAAIPIRHPASSPPARPSTTARRGAAASGRRTRQRPRRAAAARRPGSRNAEGRSRDRPRSPSVKSSAGRGFTPPAADQVGCGLPARRSAAPPRSCAALHHGHVDGRPALLLFQADLGDDRARQTGDVPRGDPVQRVDQHVVPAHVAAAEFREMRPQRTRRRRGRAPRPVVDHRTASAGVTTAPVKVDPVVPVSRHVVVLARRRSAGQIEQDQMIGPGAGQHEARPAGPAAPPAPRARCPRAPTFFRRALARTASMSRSSRSDATSSAT